MDITMSRTDCQHIVWALKILEENLDRAVPPAYWVQEREGLRKLRSTMEEHLDKG